MPWLLLSCVARAGVFVGPSGAPSPLTDATRALTWREGGDTVAILQQDAIGAGASFGWITPVPRGLAPSDVIAADGAALAGLDRWTAPRVAAPTCDALVTDQDLGCGEAPAPLADIPVERVLADDAGEALGVWSTDVLDTGDVDGTLVALRDWMAARDLVFPPGAEEALGFAANAGDVFVVAEWVGDPPADGAWLPPLRIRWTQAIWELPLRSADPSTLGSHDSVIWAVSGPDEGRAEPVNYVAAHLDDRCMPPVGTPDSWYDLTLDAALPGEILPLYAVEFSAALPDPGAPELGGAPATGTLSRLHLRYAAGTLDQDLQLAPTGSPDPAEILWYEPDATLEWALPVCGEGFRDDPGTCPGVTLESRDTAGCSTARGPGWLALAVGALALVRRRRAGAALALAGALGSAEARAGEGLVPRYALAFEAPVWSTVRLGDDETDARGAPSLDYPTIGFDGRAQLAGTGAVSLGATVGLRGWAGRASLDPDEAYVLSTFFEPSLGLSVTHGRMGDGWATPMVGYGAAAALGLLHSSAYQTVGSIGPLLHVRAGAWLGRHETRRTEVALQVSGIPRFDTRYVAFAEGTGLPGFRYHPGTLNVTLALGGVFGVRPGPSPAASSRP